MVSLLCFHSVDFGVGPRHSLSLSSHGFRYRNTCDHRSTLFLLNHNSTKEIKLKEKKKYLRTSSSSSSRRWHIIESLHLLHLPPKQKENEKKKNPFATCLIYIQLTLSLCVHLSAQSSYILFIGFTMMLSLP